MKEVKPLPLTHAAKGSWGVCHHPCFCEQSSEEQTIPVKDKKYKLLRASVKPEGANSEENDQLARILARLARQKELFLLPGCKAGSHGPGQSGLPWPAVRLPATSRNGITLGGEVEDREVG